MGKKKRSGIVRTTISLPRDLRRRMQACGEGVNWSAIAARAFEAEVARINLTAGESNVEDVVARLRETQLHGRGELYKKGALAGKSWAEQQASALELNRLYTRYRETKSERGAGPENWLTKGSRLSAAKAFAQIIRPDEGNASEFWRTVISDDLESSGQADEFVHGFAGGALHVWKHVRDKL
jgi:hypothetical protein